VRYVLGMEGIRVPLNIVQLSSTPHPPKWPRSVRRAAAGPESLVGAREDLADGGRQ